MVTSGNCLTSALKKSDPEQPFSKPYHSCGRSSSSARCSSGWPGMEPMNALLTRSRLDDVLGLQIGGEELGVADERVERAPALEVHVDVDAAMPPQDLEPQDVGALDRMPDALTHLRPAQVGRQVVLRPEPVIPVGVVVPPGLDVAREVVGKRVLAQPDLVNGPRDHRRAP
jgi:hypothetical protein